MDTSCMHPIHCNIPVLINPKILFSLNTICRSLFIFTFTLRFYVNLTGLQIFHEIFISRIYQKRYFFIFFSVTKFQISTISLAILIHSIITIFLFFSKPFNRQKRESYSYTRHLTHTRDIFLIVL